MSEMPKAELLSGWRTARVGEILKVRNGYAFKSSDYKPEGVRLIRQSDLREDRVDVTGTKRVDARFIEELPNFVVRGGDLLIGMSGSLGKIARYDDAEPALQNQRTGLLVLKPGITPNFATLILKYVEQQIVAEGKGIAVQNVSAKEIEDCVFPLAPEPARSQIVAEIEKQFTRLDAGVAGLRRVQANLKRYHAAVLKSACEGKLVPTEAELARQEGRTYETGAQLLERIFVERGKRRSGDRNCTDPKRPDTKNLPPIPQGWVWASPEHLAEFQDNAICAGPFGTIFKAKDFRSDGIPIIFLRHVAAGRYLTDKPGFMDKTKWEELFQPYSVYGGELLIAKLGEPPGACAIYPHNIGPAMVTPDVIKMSVNKRAILPKFLMTYFNSELARRFTTGVAFGTTRLRLTLPIFREMPVPLPPLIEQQRIVAEVEHRLSVIEELEVIVKANLQRATRLRQSILQGAFEGKLTRPC
jgi:type I restriction enzyme S subunit